MLLKLAQWIFDMDGTSGTWGQSFLLLAVSDETLVVSLLPSLAENITTHSEYLINFVNQTHNYAKSWQSAYNKSH